MPAACDTGRLRWRPSAGAGAGRAQRPRENHSDEARNKNAFFRRKSGNSAWHSLFSDKNEEIWTIMSYLHNMTARSGLYKTDF